VSVVVATIGARRSAGGGIVIWVVLGTIGLGLLVVGSVVGGLIGLVFAPHREAPSQKQLTVLAMLGIAAFVAMLVTAETVGGAWFTVPIGAWVVALAFIRNSAPKRETPQQRSAREAADKQDEAAAKAARERERADAFGREGVALMDRAKLAVYNVMVTEAAREGWLGEHGDLDFSTDLAMIAKTLRQARRIEKVVAESKAIPTPTDDDTRMVRDGERAIKQLRGDVTRRVQILDDCAKQARQVDRTLADERKQARLAAQRDEARSRLSAELYGVAATPSVPVSNAADAVNARVAAFRELKGVIDEQRRLEITAANGSVEADPPSPPPHPLNWFRRQLPF
jgi:hypothetical protein